MICRVCFDVFLTVTHINGCPPTIPPKSKNPRVFSHKKKKKTKRACAKGSDDHRLVDIRQNMHRKILQFFCFVAEMLQYRRAPDLCPKEGGEKAVKEVSSDSICFQLPKTTCYIKEGEVIWSLPWSFFFEKNPYHSLPHLIGDDWVDCMSQIMTTSSCINKTFQLDEFWALEMEKNLA